MGNAGEGDKKGWDRREGIWGSGHNGGRVTRDGEAEGVADVSEEEVGEAKVGGQNGYGGGEGSVAESSKLVKDVHARGSGRRPDRGPERLSGGEH